MFANYGQEGTGFNTTYRAGTGRRNDEEPILSADEPYSGALRKINQCYK